MKRYIFTLDSQVLPVIIMAKNMQSAIAKLCSGDFYKEEEIKQVEIIKPKTN